MTPMICRNCGANLPLDAIDRSLHVVTCEHCGGVHELERPATNESQRPATPADARARLPERGAVALPSRFTVERRDGVLRVSWPRGRRSAAVALCGFAVIWAAVTGSAGVWPFTAIAPVLAYLGLVRGFNRMHLHIDAAGIEVRQGPLPWPGATRLAKGEIRQLFALERLSTLRSGEDGRQRVSTHRHYSLCALTSVAGRTSDKRQASKRVTVLSGLNGVEQALWLEQEGERALGIRDAPVVGEIPR